MIDRETMRRTLLSKPEAEETYPFGQETLVARVAGKMFALLAPDNAPARLSLKCDPDRGELLRAEYAAIQPGYHLNKRHWVTLTLDDSLDPALVQDLLDESYRLVVRCLPRATRVRLMSHR
jgi:predicted DNA-binding protein (MmcQ/YjbR family)